MNKEYKRARTILVLGIISLLFLLLGIILFISFFGLGASGSFTDPFGQQIITQQAFMMLVIAIVGIVLCIIISLVAAVLILAGKFNNKQVDDLKIIMGILTLIVIGPVAAIIFGAIAMNKLKAGSKSSGTESSDSNNIVDPII